MRNSKKSIPIRSQAVQFLSTNLNQNSQQEQNFSSKQQTNYHERNSYNSTNSLSNLKNVKSEYNLPYKESNFKKRQSNILENRKSSIPTQSFLTDIANIREIYQRNNITNFIQNRKTKSITQATPNNEDQQQQQQQNNLHQFNKLFLENLNRSQTNINFPNSNSTSCRDFFNRDVMPYQTVRKEQKQEQYKYSKQMQQMLNFKHKHNINLKKKIDEKFDKITKQNQDKNFLKLQKIQRSHNSLFKNLSYNNLSKDNPNLDYLENLKNGEDLMDKTKKSNKIQIEYVQYDNNNTNNNSPIYHQTNYSTNLNQGLFCNKHRSLQNLGRNSIHNSPLEVSINDETSQKFNQSQYQKYQTNNNFNNSQQEKQSNISNIINNNHNNQTKNRHKLMKRQRLEQLKFEPILQHVPGRYNINYHQIDKNLSNLNFGKQTGKDIYPINHPSSKNNQKNKSIMSNSIDLEDDEIQTAIKNANRLKNLEYENEENEIKKLKLKGNAFLLDQNSLFQLEQQHKKQRREKYLQKQKDNAENFEKMYNQIQAQVKNDVEYQIKKKMPKPGENNTSEKYITNQANHELYPGQNYNIAGTKNDKFSIKPVDDFVENFDREFLFKIQEAKLHLQNIKYLSSI